MICKCFIFTIDIASFHTADTIESLFYAHGLVHKNEREYLSWRNSLAAMQKILDTPDFSDNLSIAIEYNIPQTSKRVDFIIAGENNEGIPNIIVIELKQWEEARKTTRRHIVKAYTGGEIRDVPHPSYQAYSYAMIIENCCEIVQKEKMQIHPCAYLHNYRPDKIQQLVCGEYEDILEKSPLYIKSDEERFREFIKRYVTKPSKRDLMYEIDNSRIKHSKALQDTIGSMMKGNEEFVLIAKQKVVFETVIKKVENCLRSGQKCTVIIEGGAGTGKSVVAIRLLAELIQQGYNARYVTKNAQPRKVYFEKLRKERYGIDYINNLFSHSGAYVSSASNTFDCLIVDEAHRLTRRSYQSRRGTIGENQIKEIINSARVSVFFIDESQIVTSNDIGSIAEIRNWADQLHSELYHDESTILHSQFRCAGSDAYLSFLEQILGFQPLDLDAINDMDYDFRVFDDPQVFRSVLREKNKINNKARMVAGYCYDWVSKKHENEDIFDISLINGFQAKWNFDNTRIWAIDPDSFEQVGCIHTCQGLEFDYIGVIIGKDLVYENGALKFVPAGRSKDDYSLKGLWGKHGDELARSIIRNTYKTLLTRGQKGCFVFCEDSALRSFFKDCLTTVKQKGGEG